MRLRRPDIERRIRERARLRRPGLRRPLSELESSLLRGAAVALWTGAALLLAERAVDYVVARAEAAPRSIGFWPLLLAPAWLGIVLFLAREMLYGPLASSAIGILAPLPVPDEDILRHFFVRVRRTAIGLAVATGVVLLLVLHVGHRLTLVTAVGTVALACLQAASALGMSLLVAQRLPALTRELVLGVALLAALGGFLVALVGFLVGADPGRSAWMALVVPTGWLPLVWSHGLVLGDPSAWFCLVIPIALAAAAPVVFRSMLRVYRIREVLYTGPEAYAVLGEPTGEVGTPDEPERVTRGEALEHLRSEGLLASESTWQASGAANRLLRHLLTIEERCAALLVLPDDPMRARRLGVALGILVAGALLTATADPQGGTLVAAALVASALALPLRGGVFVGYDPWPTGSGYTPLHSVFPLDHRAALRLMIKVGALRTALFAPFLVAALAGFARVSGLGAGAGALFAAKVLACVVLAQPYLAGMRLLGTTTDRRRLVPAMLGRIAGLSLFVVLGIFAAGELFIPVRWVALSGLVVLLVAAASFQALAFRHFDRGSVDLTISRR